MAHAVMQSLQTCTHGIAVSRCRMTSAEGLRCAQSGWLPVGESGRRGAIRADSRDSDRPGLMVTWLEPISADVPRGLEHRRVLY